MKRPADNFAPSLWPRDDVGSTADFSHHNLENTADTEVDVKLEELTILAEKCVISKERAGVKEEYQELDKEGTRLWNISTELTRRTGNGDEGDAVKGRLLHGVYLSLDVEVAFVSLAVTGLTKVW